MILNTEAEPFPCTSDDYVVRAWLGYLESVGLGEPEVVDLRPGYGFNPNSEADE